MRRIQKTHQLLAVVLLVALLIPMFAIGSYASAKVEYYFNFVDTNTVSGEKNDVGSDSGKYAGVSITSANFALGNARFVLYDAAGEQASDLSGRYTTLQTGISLKYYSDAYLYQYCDVTLEGRREGNTVYVSGKFQP